LACIPEILQSDNGSEFFGNCIYYIKEYFKTVQILKGKPLCPHEQGCVERCNTDLKIVLLKLEQEYPDKKWLIIEIHVGNIELEPMTIKKYDKKKRVLQRHIY